MPPGLARVLLWLVHTAYALAVAAVTASADLATLGAAAAGELLPDSVWPPQKTELHPPEHLALIVPTSARRAVPHILSWAADIGTLKCTVYETGPSAMAPLALTAAEVAAATTPAPARGVVVLPSSEPAPLDSAATDAMYVHLEDARSFGPAPLAVAAKRLAADVTAGRLAASDIGEGHVDAALGAEGVAGLGPVDVALVVGDGGALTIAGFNPWLLANTEFVALAPRGGAAFITRADD
ncbi:uncharacterized protein AMSG_01432 [Thecamonas trahens ATCC 50062]|uniref:Uncharacterized protein n=1 Tax=Thecamonas trahens ATCC 50062 TaxID=461836 RepID=A0A0L0DN38_THETB|nr:hypothetical protein AMSG_01432 [Thecamonas trahens ATCC 50062]KNC53722.1 hypothetical protein AMSG_01432 [Thecamonas trahens ATCC 50062]|eukprot:XP_013762036.1 hypothetical protein AMSG_01432 [Thecamonas trahens ATCC 50062]